MFKPIHLFTSLTILLAALTVSASNPVNYDTSKWTIHSAFENQPRKILDTPDATYFLVHQRLYSPNPNEYGGFHRTPSGAIFMYDKKNPSAGLQDLANIAHFSGFDIRLLNYNPITNSLVIAYTDGGLDIIGPDKSVTYIDDIKKRILPGANEITAINFERGNGSIWLGTKRGFVHLDPKTFEVLQDTKWDDAVTDIIPVGDDIIAICGNTILSAPASSNFSQRNSFKPITMTGDASVLGTVVNIMPLTEKYFATVNSDGRIHKFTRNEDNTWAIKHEANMETLSTSYVVSRVDHTVTPTVSGYYISSPKYAYLIDRPSTPDGEATVRRLQFSEEGDVINGSYDLKTFWFYGGPRQFFSKSYENGSWSQTVNTPELNAPVTSRDNFILYSPTQGLIFVSRNPQTIAYNTTQTKPALIASYRNGKWTDLSPMYHPPYLTETNQQAWQDFTNMSTWGKKWPVANPYGAFIDPINTDVLHMGSLWEGIASVYLDDPKKNPHLVVLNRSDALSSFNAYHYLQVLGRNAWADPIRALGADVNNVIWFYYDISQDTWNGTDLVFHYVTPEGRMEQLNDPDPQKIPQPFKWNKLTAHGNVIADWWSCGTPLRHPDNQTKLVVTNFEGDFDGGKGIRILDHKGTLDDPSDDEVTVIRNFRLASGDTREPIDIHDIVENPVTGDIVLTSFYDTFIINLKDPIVGGVINARSIVNTGENGQSSHFRPATTANYATFDEYGRLWITTPYNGVIGVSADGKSIIANFNESNSPLGSNDVRGIGWNPETKSLFISADNVVAEVRVDTPDAIVGIDSVNAPFLSPDKVLPDFGGTVAIFNVPAGTSVRIRNSEGKTVRELLPSDNGILYWDLLDSEGNYVPSGKYTLLDATGNNSFEPMHLPVVR